MVLQRTSMYMCRFPASVGFLGFEFGKNQRGRSKRKGRDKIRRERKGDVSMVDFLEIPRLQSLCLTFPIISPNLKEYLTQ